MQAMRLRAQNRTSLASKGKIDGAQASAQGKTSSTSSCESEFPQQGKSNLFQTHGFDHSDAPLSPSRRLGFSEHRQLRLNIPKEVRMQSGCQLDNPADHRLTQQTCANPYRLVDLHAHDALTP